MPDKEDHVEKSEDAKPVPKSMPRDCNKIDAINPFDGTTWQLFVRNRKVQETARKGMGAARELAFTVLEAVQHPTAVYRGVTELDDGEDDWLCYVSLPARAYDYKTANTVKAWEGEVFLVFVDGDLIVRRWSWSEADSANPRLPINHDKGRFKEKLL